MPINKRDIYKYGSDNDKKVKKKKRLQKIKKYPQASFQKCICLFYLIMFFTLTDLSKMW